MFSETFEIWVWNTRKDFLFLFLHQTISITHTFKDRTSPIQRHAHSNTKRMQHKTHNTIDEHQLFVNKFSSSQHLLSVVAEYKFYLPVSLNHLVSFRRQDELDTRLIKEWKILTRIVEKPWKNQKKIISEERLLEKVLNDKILKCSKPRWTHSSLTLISTSAQGKFSSFLLDFLHVKVKTM